MGGYQMSFEAITNSIRCKFVDDVEPLINVPVQYDNAPFTKPSTGFWVRFQNTFTTSRQIEVSGDEPTRVEGIAIALVHGPIEQGNLGNLQITKAIVNAFRGVTFQGVIFRTPVPRSLGRAGKEWRTEVSCPFYKDDLV